MILIKSDYAFAFVNWGEVNGIAKPAPFCGPGAISRGTESFAGPVVVSGVLAPVHSLTGSTHISLMTFRGHGWHIKKIHGHKGAKLASPCLLTCGFVP